MQIQTANHGGHLEKYVFFLNNQVFESGRATWGAVIQKEENTFCLHCWLLQAEVLCLRIFASSLSL